MVDRILRRRDILSGALGVMALGVAGPVAARERALFDLVEHPLGIQLYMMGGELASDPQALFAALANLGYRRFEGDLARVGQPQFRAAAQRHGLSFTSVHLNPLALQPEKDGDFAKIVEEARAIGVRYAGLPIFPFSPALLKGNRDPMEVALARIAEGMAEDDWKRVADVLNRRGEQLHAAGIQIFYHNHNVEFRTLGRTTPFDILMRYTDPHLVCFELDVGWVAAAGLDPVAVLGKYPGRFRLMHVKDIGAATEANFAFKQVPETVGGGKLDWRRLIPAARAAGIAEFFVEQEPPFTGSRMDAAAASARYLLGGTAR
jgi:sugar phosphate isomerase/epimerase